MRTTLAVLMMAGSLAASPLVALAATPGAAASPAAAAAATKAAKGTHATAGTVKSLTDSTLVLTKAGKRHREMTFQLGSSVHKEGSPAVGSHVSIRYQDQGKTHVATAITVRQKA